MLSTTLSKPGGQGSPLCAFHSLPLRWQSSLPCRRWLHYFSCFCGKMHDKSSFGKGKFVHPRALSLEAQFTMLEITVASNHSVSAARKQSTVRTPAYGMVLPSPSPYRTGPLTLVNLSRNVLTDIPRGFFPRL